jgi:hypothetical protein
VIPPIPASMATFSPHSTLGSNGEESGDLSPTSSTSDQEGEYVVDRIISQNVPDGNGEEEEMYLVRWEGYPDEQCTVSPGTFLTCLFCKAFAVSLLI